MSDREQKQESTNISPEPSEENKKKKEETALSEEELKGATGGCTGSHIKQ
jgi:hypothetical protein